MRIHRLFLLTVILLTASMMLVNVSVANQVKGYATKLTVTDNTGASTVLYFGFTNSTSTTRCIDGADTVEIDQFGVTVLEYENPPVPPEGIFDARFVETRTSGTDCFGVGVPVNFHQRPASASTVFADTFKVKFQPATGGFPVTFTWENFDPSLVQASGFFRFKYVDMSSGDPVSVTRDMTAQNSEVISADAAVTAVTIYFNGTVGVRQTSDVVPATFALNQAYPNPFNPSTSFSFNVAQSAKTTITVYDILGRTVSTILSEDLTPGTYTSTWNGMTNDGFAAASGTYFIRMSARYQNDQFVSVQKVLLMK